MPVGIMSRPVWGAWIEIFAVSALQEAAPSRPVWGAWIEIGVSRMYRRSVLVAPRMGRVD